MVNNSSEVVIFCEDSNRRSEMHMSSSELDFYSGEKPFPFRSSFSRELGVIDV